MWKQMARRRGWRMAGLLGVVGLAALLAGCGGSSAAPWLLHRIFRGPRLKGRRGVRRARQPRQARHHADIDSATERSISHQVAWREHDLA